MYMVEIVIDVISLPDLPNLKPTRRMMAGAGGAVAKAMREHFMARGGSAFWGQISEATALTDWTDIEATITVSPPWGYYLMHKVNGGRVSAKPPRTYLAIPANSQAKAAGWPSHWSTSGDGKLRVLYGRNGPYALALNQNLLRWGRKNGPRASQAALRAGRKGNWGRGVIMYWLKRSVYHRPDPHAMPEHGVLDAAAEKSVRGYIEREIERADKALKNWQ